MERPWVQEALEEIKRLDQNPKTRRLADFKEQELMDIIQREEDAREDGREDTKREIVISLYTNGMSAEKIAKYVRLPFEKVADIIRSIQQ